MGRNIFLRRIAIMVLMVVLSSVSLTELLMQIISPISCGAILTNSGYLNDLYIDRVHIIPISPPSYQIKVGVTKICGYLPSNPRLHVILNDILQYDLDMSVLNMSTTTSWYGAIGIENLYVGDNLTFVIDPPGLVPDLNRKNNILEWIFYVEDNRPPYEMSTVLGTLRRQKDYQNVTRTHYFPYMVLRIAPFERSECVPTAKTSTYFAKETYITHTDSHWCTLTAGLAIETEVDVGAAKATFGVEVEYEYESKQSGSSTKTKGEGYKKEIFVADMNADDGIIATQTVHENWEYNIISGPNSGKRVWIGRPKDPPEFTLMDLTAYNEHYRDDEAPEILFDGKGNIGDLNSYPKGRYEPSTLTSSDWNLMFDTWENTGDRYSQGIGAGSIQTWLYRVSNNSEITTSQSVGVNFYAKGTIAGTVSVQASFGAKFGWSHSTEIGYQSEYGGDIAPVQDEYDKFYLIPFMGLTKDDIGYFFLAYYRAPKYTYLTIEPSTEGWTEPPAGTHGPYTVGATRVVTAYPFEPYTFISWNLDGNHHSYNNPETFVMDDDHTVEATYIYMPPHVGGKIVTIDKLGMLAPYIGSGLIILTAIVISLWWRFKDRD